MSIELGESAWTASKRFLGQGGRSRLQRGSVLTSEIRLFLLGSNVPSIKDFAEVSGVNARQIYRIRYGKSRYTEIHVAERLMIALGHNPGELKTVCP